ncbi:ClC family H(+)/Cl(-) exchange transporter [Agrilactobacillus yilanensis]|uniref:ClC family H(+)/Cl(-) exchange transporter n=1 Tax=Agrilactobacillus yilanensis TaxID=2485997 RepID=A0ABW4JAB3_9LACO|nr:ClC family H(+)/Cl(-) exchange transporter [Agrilactobacillus yilanensis]
MKRNHTYLNFDKLGFIWRGLVIGLLAGFVTAAFRFAIEKFLVGMQFVYNGIKAGHIWWLVPVIIGLTAIGLFVGLLLRQRPEISGSGIPQVEAQLDDELDYNWWSILWRKFVGGVLAIGPGLFLGREGPSIQLGAAVGQGVAHGFHANGADRRIMIAAGAAGGLSAAFNAPIAGTMFVLEEVYHNFSYPVWLTSLASAVGANFISLNIFGLQPILHLNYQRSMPVTQYWHLLVLGIILGVLGRFYQYCLLSQGKAYRLFKFLPRSLHGLVPLLVVVPLGVWHADWLGGGNGLIISFNQAQLSILTLSLLLLVRFAFSMLSYGSGLPGGIFLPILSLGAVIGALYGAIMVHLGLLAPMYWYNLVIFAMAGYFAAIGKAPFTAILLVTEMVGSLVHLMPLAVLSLVAYGIDDMLNGAPIYESLRQRLKAMALSTHRSLDQVQLPVFEIPGAQPFKVKDFNWPSNCLLISIQRGEYRIIPKGGSLIRPGDTLIMLVPSGRVGHFKQLIGQEIQKMYD